MKRQLPFLLSLPLLLVCNGSSAQGFAGEVEEASGITRVGDELLIVGDNDAGAYYRFRLHGDEGPLIPIDPNRVRRVTLPKADLAIDLEAIDVLADGRVVVLSEDLHALVGDGGVVVGYDNSLSEFGNRGLEGLAVRRLGDGYSRIAVLWEGGYPEYEDVPMQLRRHFGRLPMRPVVLVHDLKAGKIGIRIKMKNALQVIELDVPRPKGQEPQAQRFGASDLVWTKWYSGGNERWGFIVLLTSQNSPEQGKPEYRHQWLQRFTVGGKPLGRPLDLNTVVPANLKGANWEGLGWFEEGKSLVLIHDEPPKRRPTAFIVKLPGN